MARRLPTLQPRVGKAPQRLQAAPTTSDRRMSGRSLQDRRLRMWTKNPHCARCGKLVAYPFGFDLDHVIPLYKGGHDVEGNCQILCNGPGGCHELKTAEDARRN